MSHIHQEAVFVLKGKLMAASEALEKLKEQNESDIKSRQQHYQSSFDSKAEDFQVEIENLKLKHESERQAEEMRIEQYNISQRQKMKDLEEEREKMIERLSREEESMTCEMEENIRLEIQKHNDLIKEKNELLLKHKEVVDAMETGADEEMDEDNKAFRNAVHQERKVALRLRGENDIRKKKYDALMKDFEEHRETIVSLKEKQVQLSDSIMGLKHIKSDRERELKQLDRSIVDADIAINNATVETHKMEK